MQGRLEHQIKTEKTIERLLADMPSVCSEYYYNFSANKEFKSCLEYIRSLRRFLLYVNSDMEKIDFASITDTDIAKYLKDLETKETKYGITYTSFSYRKQSWSVLNSFFGFLFKKGYITSNPVALLERPSKKDKVNHTFLSQKDLDAMIMAAKNGAGTERSVNRQELWQERDVAILYTFIMTGMRESALCEIDMNQVDFTTNTLSVIDKEHKFNTYHINPVLRKALKDWIVKREMLLGGEECDALFISNRRGRMSVGTVTAIVKKYSYEAIGKSVSPHRLRAAFGNIIYQKTGDIGLTSSAMKHEDISTTRIYMENDEKKVNRKVADIMTDVFS